MLPLALLLAFEQSPLLLSVVNSSFLQFLSKYLNGSSFNLLSKERLVLVSNEGSGFVERALNVFANQIFEKRSGG